MKIKLFFAIAAMATMQPSISKAGNATDLPRVGAPHGESRPRNRFVQDILGITEQAFSRLSREDQLDLLRQSGFNHGNFQIYSLNDLSDMYREKRAQAPQPEANGSLHVIEGVDPIRNPLVLRQVDTGSLQAHWGLACQENEKRATFMVASNSNGLETTSYQDIPTHISRYTTDRTQGPAASISAAPATLWRNYLAFHGDRRRGTEHLPWRQDAEQQLNFLEEILDTVARKHRIDIPMSNGYLAFRTPDLARHIADEQLLNAIATTFEANRGAIQVGVHAGVAVSHGLCEDAHNHRFLNKPEERPLINQVFCAALDLGQGTNPITDATRRIAQCLLKAQVKATLYAAYINNTDTVVLTMLGCGAFHNQYAWFIEAVRDCQELIQQSGMKVVVNLFSGNIGGANEERLLEIVNATGGSWHRYSQNGDKLAVEDISQQPNQQARL